MRFAVISLTLNGAHIAGKISAALNKKHYAEHYTFYKYPFDGAVEFNDLSQLIKEIFYMIDGIIFVSAVGIAVRAISGFVRSKITDPAIIAIDESGRFAVSVLSGHLGGGNELTEFIANVTGACAVVTTATNTGKKFSPDSFAAANFLHICSMDMVKKIAASVLNDVKIGIDSDYPYKNKHFDTDNNSDYGICISDDTSKKPFKYTLNLSPKKISVGIGCKKNLDSEIFENFIIKMLASESIELKNVRCISTIDIKRNETAVIRFCRKYAIPLNFYSSQQLMNVKGRFSESEFVKMVTGVDNVCERSAVVGGGRLIVKKHSENGMTFAAAENDVDIDFERRIF